MSEMKDSRSGSSGATPRELSRFENERGALAPRDR